MSFLSIMEARLPPGFRFHPRDEELICDYLAKKIAGDDSGSLFGCPTMVDVDLNKVEPWDLPEMACVGGKEWYFYSLRDRKYATGQRTNRATVSGYWKATGKDRHVTRQGRLLVGMRKTLVFYQGRAPKGTKTDWVMHEFRMQLSAEDSNFSVKEDWVLCRVFYKSRSLSSKPSMDTNYDQDTTSSSLQPLTETYITFGQTPAASFEGHEQVPCFSNPFQSSSMAMAVAAPPVVPTAIQRNMMPFKNPAAAYAWGLPDLASGLNQYQLDCDRKVMRTVLNHLTNTKLEGNQKTKRDPHPSIGEEESIDSYLYLSSSENAGLSSSMW